MEDLKLICSLATWRTLRSKEKTQNDVIVIFCKNVISKHYSVVSFSLQELSKKIEEEYGFVIIDSILVEILSKNLKEYLKENREDKLNTYSVKKPVEVDKRLQEIIDKYIEDYKNFSNEFENFLNKKIKNCPKNIVGLFNEFLLDKDLDKEESRPLLPYFNEFLLSNKQKYNQLLQTIKEGVILYEGLKYKIVKQKQKRQIELFLDTEILFHAMGYNGELYKKKFDDFYSLVRKYDENKYLMPLYYNEITKEEVEKFFNAAKEIRKQNAANYARNTAMQYLMEHCRDSVEVESKETELFYILKKEFTIKSYEEHKQNATYNELLKQYPKFNLESLETLENIKQELKTKNNEKNIDEKISKSIMQLSFINMIRRDKIKNLFDAKVLFITDTSMTNSMAWHKDIIEDKTIPLSSNLDFITARLWEFLETSLGEPVKIESLNPIFALQITLKEILADALYKQYEKVQRDFKKNGDKELLKQEIIDIQDKMKLEPNIKNMEIFEIILSDDDIKEQKKLYNIEKEKSFKEGIEIGKEQGRKEAKEEFQHQLEEIERENKRKQKRDNYSKRLKQYKKKRCERNIKNIPKQLLVFVKRHVIAITTIISLIASLITIFAFVQGYFHAN